MSNEETRTALEILNAVAPSLETSTLFITVGKPTMGRVAVTVYSLYDTKASSLAAFEAAKSVRAAMRTSPTPFRMSLKIARSWRYNEARTRTLGALATFVVEV